jgi:hypothetical protein
MISQKSSPLTLTLSPRRGEADGDVPAGIVTASRWKWVTSLLARGEGEGEEFKPF